MNRLQHAIALLALTVVAACGPATRGTVADGGTSDAGPTFAPVPDVSLFAGQTRTVTVKATDPDGDALTYALAPGGPDWITLDGATLAFAPPAGTTFAGTVTVSATDTRHLAASASLAVAVSPGRISGTVVVDGGAAFTASPDVTLALTGHSLVGTVATMAFSNDGVTFSAPEPFATTKAWTLDATSDGKKTVTVRLTDASGATARILGTIDLDTTPPSACCVVLDGGAPVTASLDATVTLAASDGHGSGVATVAFSEDGTTFGAPVPYAATLPYALSPGDGPHTVYVRVTDQVGNATVAPYPGATILVDQTPPTGGTVAIDGGAPFTNTTAVTLTLGLTDTGSGPGDVCIKSVTRGFAAPTPPAADDPCFDTPFAASVPYTLNAQIDGMQTVFVWFEDAAGNLDPTPATAEIDLDRTPPTLIGPLSVGVRYHTVDFAPVGATDPAPGSGLDHYEVGYRLAGTTAPFTYAPAPLVGTLPNQHHPEVELSAAHSYDVVLRAVDRAGNASADLGPVTATTYFPWTHENRLPAGYSNKVTMSAGVMGGDHLVAGAPYAGDAWIDNADGFATTRRLDAAPVAVVAAGSTGRGLVIEPTDVRATGDLGTTFWPVTLDPPPPVKLLTGAWLGATTQGQATTDRYVVLGANNVYLGSVTTSPGRVPTGSFTASPIYAANPLSLQTVAHCDACTGDVLVAGAGARPPARSTDGGLTWQPLSLPAGMQSIGDVVALPGTRTFYATTPLGDVGSDDGGQTWSVVSDLQSPNGISGLALGGAGNDFTLWGFGGLGLNHWDGTTEGTVDLSSLPQYALGLEQLATVGQGATARVLAVGNQGGVATVSQGGAVVAGRNQGTTNTVGHLAFVPGSTEDAFFTDDTTQVHVTTDHGQTWTVEDTGAPALLAAVAAFADGSAVAVGASGTVMARSATGQWTQVPSGSTNAFRAIACDGAAGCLIVGTGGAVFAYDPATSAVTSVLPSSNAQVYYGVDLWTDAGGTVHGIAVGFSRAVVNNGGVYLTCTGCTTAASYSAVANIAPGATPLNRVRYLTAVAGSSDGHVVALGYNGSGIIFTSTDDGATWTRNGTTVGSMANAVAHVPGTTTWYAVGTGAVLRSVSDGYSWSDVPTYTPIDARSLAVAPTATGTAVLVGGANGQLLYSGTGGL